MTEHVAGDQLRRFVKGQGTRAENRQVVEHLLGECGQCRSVVREVLRPEIPQGAYDEPFDRMLGRIVSEQRLGTVALRILANLELALVPPDPG
jgi:hypothetical protein